MPVCGCFLASLKKSNSAPWWFEVLTMQHHRQFSKGASKSLIPSATVTQWSYWVAQGSLPKFPDAFRVLCDKRLGTQLFSVCAPFNDSVSVVTSLTFMVHTLFTELKTNIWTSELCETSFKMSVLSDHASPTHSHVHPSPQDPLCAHPHWVWIHLPLSWVAARLAVSV